MPSLGRWVNLHLDGKGKVIECGIKGSSAVKSLPDVPSPRGRTWRFPSPNAPAGARASPGPSPRASSSDETTTATQRGGRRLSSGGSSCRWTPKATGSATFACTQLHEYLERKTTTHLFNSIETCLGSDHTQWGWKFDGSTANTTLTGPAQGPLHVLTPLQVAHSKAENGSHKSTLTLVHDTVVVAGSLTVGGYDVVATLTQLRMPSPPPSPP